MGGRGGCQDTSKERERRGGGGGGEREEGRAYLCIHPIVGRDGASKGGQEGAREGGKEARRNENHPEDGKKEGTEEGWAYLYVHPEVSRDGASNGPMAPSRFFFFLAELMHAKEGRKADRRD